MGVLDNLQSSQEERRDRREDEFQRRLAVQQFLKHHGPLLQAWLASGATTQDAGKPGEFVKRSQEARALAVAIAARLSGRPVEQVSLSDARHFRAEAAEVVAQFVGSDRSTPIESIANSVAEVLELADPTYDAETIDWRKLSGRASSAMTITRAAMLLWSSVQTYDFRLGREAVMSRLTTALSEAVDDGLALLLPAEAGEEDRRVLSQTLMRELSGNVLIPLYERESRSVVARLLPLGESERRARLAQDRPLDALIERFMTEARVCAKLAAATAQHLAAEQRQASHPTP